MSKKFISYRLSVISYSLLVTFYLLLTAGNLWAAKECRNTYCHGNFEGSGRGSTATWSSPSTGKCGTCHSAGRYGVYDSPASTAPKGGSHYVHTSTVSTAGYNYLCKLCHDATVTNWGESTTTVRLSTATHVAGQATDLRFSTDTRTGGGKYDGQISYSTSPPNTPYEECTNLYCHSRAYDFTVTWSTPTWGNANSGRCGTCHKAGEYDLVFATAPTGWIGHYIHASTWTAEAKRVYSYDCKLCHSGTLDWAGKIVSRSTHVNYGVDVTFSTDTRTTGGRYMNKTWYTVTPPSSSYANNYSNTYCSNTYCHSDSGEVGGAVTYKTVYSTETLSCNGCHDSYRGTPSSTTLSTAHYIHIDTGTNRYGYKCYRCHNDTAKTESYTIRYTSHHVNGGSSDEKSADVVFSTHNLSGDYVNDLEQRQCQNLYCHGSITSQYSPAVPTWNTGGTALCGSCHGSGQYGVANSSQPPAGWKHSKHVSIATYNYSCRLCHEGTVNWSGAVNITTAHVQNLVDIKFSTSSLTTNATYWALGTPYSYYAGAATSATNGSYWNRACANLYCHSNANPSGTGALNNYVKVYSTDTVTCASCHKGASSGGGLNLSVSHGTHTLTTKYNYPCERCHYNTVSGTSTIKTTGYDEHVNGTDNIVFNPNWTGPNSLAGNYDAPRCSNVYCHGNFAGSGYTINIATWNIAGTAVCGSCHGAGQYDTVRATSPSGGSHRIHTSTTTYNYQCEYCHKISVSSMGVIVGYSTHTNYATNISLSTNTTIISGSAKYANTISSAISPPRSSYPSTARCTNLYCHSNGRPVSEIVYSTPTWGVAISTACTGCHKGSGYHVNSSSTISTGKHTLHVDNATSLGTNYRCKYCHNITIANFTSDLVVSSYTGHISGTRNVDFSTVTWPTGSPQANWDTNSSSCTNVYCHSNGVPKTVADYKQVKWTAGTTLCYDCHGSTTTENPAPAYTGASAGVAYTSYTALQANSHGSHSNNCNYCHYRTAVSSTTLKSGTTIHTDVYWDVYFDTQALNSANASYTRYGTDGKSTSTADNMTCSNTGNSCHSGSAAQWGGTLKCVSCHGTGYDADNVTGTFWLDGFISKVSTDEWTYSGHGKSTTPPNNLYDVSLSTGAGFDQGGENGCLYCHDDDGTQHKKASNPFRLEMANGGEYETGQSTWNKVCLICHSSDFSGYQPSGGGYLLKNGKDIDSAHYGTKHTTTTAGGRFCWDCHDPHGDRLNSTTGNIYMVHSTVTRISDGTFGYVSSVSTTPATRLYTLFTSTTPSTTGFYASSTTTPSFAGICNVCHMTAAHYRNDFGEFHYSGDRCTKCHQHQGRFGAACTQCHAYPPSPYDGKISTAAPPDGNYLGNPYGKGKHYTNLDATTTVHLNIAVATQPANQIYAAGNTECGQCHDLNVGSKHNDGVVQVGTLHISSATFYNNNLVVFSTSSWGGYAVYRSTPGGAQNNKKCVNTACHFGRESPVWSP